MRPRKQTARLWTQRVHNWETLEKLEKHVKAAPVKARPIFRRQLHGKRIDDVRTVLRPVRALQFLLGDSLSQKPVALDERNVHGTVRDCAGSFYDELRIIKQHPTVPVLYRQLFHHSSSIRFMLLLLKSFLYSIFCYGDEELFVNIVFCSRR